MRKAIHFGAGNIGRGFIGPVLQDNNYEVIFVDIDERLIDKLNISKEYKVFKLGNTKDNSINVQNVSAVSLNNFSAISDILNEVTLISSSVGPKFVQDVFDVINKVQFKNEVTFIAFENMYRASSTVQQNSEVANPYLTVIDAVVDKIIPPQKKDSLDVIVENYGSIILDESKTKPLEISDIVKYGHYEEEFIKKLWLLNGLHLQLAYFGISKGYKYIHEIYKSDEGKEFAIKASSELMNAFSLFAKKYDDIEEFSLKIKDRFSSDTINDELLRIARNPNIKFAENERFAKPLDILIQNDQPVESFKQIIDLLQKIDYSYIDGFNDFHYNFKNGLPNFLQNFWGLDDRNINKYLERLT